MVQFMSDGIEIACDDSGGNEREAVVLLHGLGSARSTWDPIVPVLTNQWRVLTFDQRGHGESSHASGIYTLEHYVPEAIAPAPSFTASDSEMPGRACGRERPPPAHRG
jgi:pimeloyl-ACP methyl ester carboxylesterase